MDVQSPLFRGLEVSPDGILIVCPNGFICYTNIAATTLTGSRTGQLLTDVLDIPPLTANWRGEATIRQTWNTIAVTVSQDEQTHQSILILHPSSEPAPYNFRLLFENNPLPLWIYDRETGRILAVNDAAVHTYGYSHDEFLAMRIHDMRPAEEIPRLIDNLNAPRPAFHESGEWRHRRKNGQIIDVEIISHLLTFQGYSAVFVCAQNITDRKRIEEAYQKSQERLYTILRSVHFGIFSIALPSNRPIFVSPVIEKIYGYPAAAFLNDSGFWLTTVHPDDRAYVRKMLQQRTELGVVTYEFRIITAQGELRWIHQDAWITCDINNVPIQVDGVDTDVTAYHRATHELDAYRLDLEKVVLERTNQLMEINVDLGNEIEERIRVEIELRNSEARFRSLIEFAPDYILALDLNGIVTQVNPAAIRSSGYSQDELVGHPIIDFFNQSSRQTFLTRFALLMEQGTHRFEVDLLRRDGTLRYMDCSAALVDSDEDHLAYIIVFMRDITERRNAERTVLEALDRERELSQIRSRFVKVVSHEFRTPLATIQTAVDLLKNYPDKMDTAQVAGRLNKITTQIRHMTALLDDVSSLGQFQSGQVEFAPVATQITAFAQEIIAEFEIADNQPQRITFQSKVGNQRVLIDQKLFRQILNNLLANAVKYSSGGSPISVTFTPEPGFVQISIADQGIGIPTEDVPHLFEPFHRGGNTQGIPGTGLGLAVTKEAIDLHGGAIDVTSTLGEGSTFIVKLPLYPGDRDYEQNTHHRG